MYQKKLEEVFNILKSSENGLDSQDASKRLEENGYNVLKEGKKSSFFKLFFLQFKSALILILIIAAVASIMIGEGLEAIIIFSVVLINAFIGAFQEKKADNAIQSLRNMTTPKARVLRDGKIAEIDSKQLVPGDIVILETGNYVPADLRLFEVGNLQVDESSLTGESIAVMKQIAPLKENTPLAERVNMAYRGTIVTTGKAKGIVVATGLETEIGHISKMLDIPNELTPLQKKIKQLGKMLGIICLILCFIIFILGLWYKIPFMDNLMMAISLAVAAVPEGLPAIITILLALGMQKLSKKNALVKNLNSVETLGGVTVICSDKTGTLTTNKMNVVKFYDNQEIIGIKGEGYQLVGKFSKEYDSEYIKWMCTCASLCNNAVIDGEKVIGDPTEGALLVFAARAGFSIHRNNHQFLGEYEFDSDRKLMSVMYKIENKTYLFTKGSLEDLIAKCSHILVNNELQEIEAYSAKLESVNATFAEEGLRTIGYAYKIISEKGTVENSENNLTFLGMTGMIDPEREEVKDAIKTCHKAGIDVIMITGDHPLTATTIASRIGIHTAGKSLTGIELEEMTDIELYQYLKQNGILSRVSPKDKVRVVDVLKQNGEIVAMTGDGVNDAPSLKKADIGIAMGITGTDVSKEASDVILTDDNFTSIVQSVKVGRIIYENIRKCLIFLVSCNFAEIMIVFICMLCNIGIPLTATQLLWVNLLTDSFPAFVIGLEQEEEGIMEQKPNNPNEPVITKSMLKNIMIQSISLTIVVLVAYLIGGNTYAFLTLIFGEAIRAYSNRSTKKPLLELGIFKNRLMNISLAITILSTLALLYIPGINQLFRLQATSGIDLLIVIGLSIFPCIISEAMKYWKRHSLARK